MAKFFLRKKAGERIVHGHPWVFANELGDSTGSYSAGDIVEVYSYSGTFIGKGYINPSSQIRVRILTWEKDEQIDTSFFYKKIKKAWQYKQQLGFSENCRVIHGEGDDIPGLTIDKYGQYIVLQSQSLGMERWLNDISDIIRDIFRPKGIYLRNDTPIRKLEGLDLQKDFISAAFDTNIIIEENGLNINIDIAGGPKTGYYLDHTDNRRLLSKIVNKADILDLFCHTGSFVLHALKYGAKTATGIELDDAAVSLARKNAAINGFTDDCTFISQNVFDELKALQKSRRKFDVVVSDPPPFANGKAALPKATAAYKEINLRAMQLLNSGGSLITCSSSNALDDHSFKNIVQGAANDAGKRIRQIAKGGQSADHTIRWNIPTTEYLKCYLLQVE